MHQKCSNYALTNLLFGLCRSEWVISCLSLFLAPSHCSNTPFYPRSATSQGVCLTYYSFIVFSSDSQLSLSRSLGVHHTSFMFSLAVWICHIDFHSLESSMPIFLANWTLRIIGWAHVSRNTIMSVCPPTWIVDSILSTMATPVAMEVLPLGTTLKNEWETLWKKWLSTTPLLRNKSTSEVFLAPF